MKDKPTEIEYGVRTKDEGAAVVAAASAPRMTLISIDDAIGEAVLCVALSAITEYDLFLNWNSLLHHLFHILRF